MHQTASAANNDPPVHAAGCCFRATDISSFTYETKSMLKTILALMVCFGSVGLLTGCSSNEPVLLDYSEDDFKAMDEAAGIGADGEAVEEAEFEKF
ncbi:hypothetical protein LOC71_05660 [Rhodopirellula sp. JC740]|uniref:Uncharacterized protein n=1 Tax=Rhodopirellula halodulae TaxID=2894198 RepID=A0ABS8NFP3_9BACT|nr:hypothetical protein [Rhodopirellula sp. JC740]MCC9641752.1 hypothetical protein [Rhodopirellula sp. JC740]